MSADHISLATWPLANVLSYLAGAAAAGGAALWIGRRVQRYANSGTAIVVSLILTALWCATVAINPAGLARQGLFEAVANLGWLLVVYRLFADDGRHASLAPIRPLAISLGFVELLNLAVAAIATQAEGAGGALGMMRLAIALRLLFLAGGLMLLHNLYAGAAAQSRAALRWPALGLAVLWGFDLNFYAIAYLIGEWPSDLAVLRGLAVAALAGLMSVGAARRRADLKLRPSRAVAFQTASLLLIIIYLAVMVAMAQWLSLAGGNFAQLMETGVIVVASAVAAVVLPSRRLRGWLRVTLAKHLFQHRYDYRAEWLRFTRTMGKGGEGALPLEERAVQAVADIAESPAGLLLTPSEQGELALAARWQWPSAEVPAVALDPAAAEFFRTTGRIVDLDDLRAGRHDGGESAVLPAWLREEPRAWAVIPLIHFERLAGVVVLARPSPVRKFDWEDFDLLRVVGQQLASYLAEHSVQVALAEASRFDDFNRRIAFVMHDIKNLASQLSLLARNAERHADKPEFRDDMLVTLRNSADKLNALLARLSRYGSTGASRVEQISAADLVRSVARQFEGRHPVEVAASQDCAILADRESLEQVLVHLVQNAVEASEPGVPVVVSLAGEDLTGRIEVIDSGCGMTPDFVRTRLFKPFVSSKQGGFGIGAFEARELVRAMRGRLEVESREGLGSRFVIRLPLARAGDMLKYLEQFDHKVVA